MGTRQRHGNTEPFWRFSYYRTSKGSGRHWKLSARSEFPVPSYKAELGKAQSARVKRERSATSRSAVIRPGALPCSTQSVSDQRMSREGSPGAVAWPENLRSEIPGVEPLQQFLSRVGRQRLDSSLSRYQNRNVSDTNSAIDTTSIEIRSPRWRAAIVPSLGGAVLFLRRDGLDVLRAASQATRDPLETASFALVPYANRIAERLLMVDGQHHRMPHNFGDHPHALHGVGWQSGWRVADTTDDCLTLTLDHQPGPAWPWTFRVEQQLAVDNSGFSATLTLTNVDDRAMPAGLGFHPYLPRAATARLSFDAKAMWLSDATQIPVRRVDPRHFGDWSAPRFLDVKDLVDHYYEGWDGCARLADDHGVTTISAIGARGIHLYLPPNADFLCLEPVSHGPDAFNRHDMTYDTIAPGRTLTLTMRIERD